MKDRTQEYHDLMDEIQRENRERDLEGVILYQHWMDTSHQGLGPWECCARLIQAYRGVRDGSANPEPR